MKNKKAVGPVPKVEPKAYIASGTTDSVRLHLPLDKGMQGGRYEYYLDSAATVEMLEEFTKAVRLKRAEADAEKAIENLSIKNSGIFWTRYR